MATHETGKLINNGKMTESHVIAVKNDVAPAWLVASADLSGKSPEITYTIDEATLYSEESANRTIFDLMHRWPKEKFRVESADRKVTQEQQRHELYQVKYVIHSKSEGGAFWSNKDGWGSLETATRFTTLERMDSFLPISSGGDSEWMLIEEALDLTRKVVHNNGFPDRVRFNWGFHDGSGDAERAAVRDMDTHPDKMYGNGYVRGVLAWKNLGYRPESSDDAWNAFNQVSHQTERKLQLTPIQEAVQVAEWPSEHSDKAVREGWDIWDSEGSENGRWQVQRIDDPEAFAEATGFTPQSLASDDEAFRIVANGILPHHVAAREFLRAHNPREYQAVMRFADRKVSEDEYRQELKRLESAIAKAKEWLKLPCSLAQKIERKAAVRDAEESLRQHKLNYYELVDLSQRRSEAMQVAVSTIKAEYGIDDSPSP